MSRPATRPDSASRGRLPVAARDRRPALAALALLLVVAGALGAALVVYRTGQKTDVLIAAREIKPGARVTADDLTTARVSNDAGYVIDASDEGALIGRYATTDIPANTMLNGLMFQQAGVTPAGSVDVGVSVGPAARPAGDLQAGDVVRAYSAPSNPSQGDAGPLVLVNAARVVAVSTGDSGDMVVSLLVSEDKAADLVAANAQGNVVLAQLPLGTQPDVAWRTGS